jgi:hypothetical protein|nr:MAG TPA: hypothetical protein [Caudoviricetes sp.]
MIYLILFGLDFYEKFHALLFTASLLLSIGTLIGLAMRLILQPVNIDIADDTILSAWNLAIKLFKLKKLTIFLVCFTILIPSPKTVNITTGIYAGEVVVDKVKDTPLAQKAYQLAEKKIDELLEESQTKDSK